MAAVETIDVTTLAGSDSFPLNVNDVYGLVETICSQNIRAVKSNNRIVDGFYDYVVENGKVIEEAIIEMAEKQSFVKTGAPDLSPVDPSLLVKYFNNWEDAQFETTIRRADIRAVLANKGVGIEEVISEILTTLNEGESDYDYGKMRAIIDSDDVGADASEEIFGGKVPKNAKGIIYALRQMYNVLKATNTKGGVSAKQATPVDDIRIAISESILNLLDVTELANAFNLQKEELFGKLVVLPYDANETNTILVYDRKALGRGTRLYEYSQDVIGKGLYTNHYLTTERCYFYNSLFKALRLDVSAAVEASIDGIMEEAEQGE